MVTFNFTDITDSGILRFNDGGGTIFTGATPLSLTSTVTGVGLFENTIKFIISPQSAFYEVNPNPSSGLVRFSGGLDSLNTSDGVYTFTFTDGAGLNALVNPTADLAAYNAGEAFWITAGGTTTAGIQDNVQFSGTVTGIKFTTSNNVRLTTLSGTLACFAAGTLIAVPSGERAVEELKIGDDVVTADGSTAQVKWLGYQTIERTWMSPKMQPVRIRAGALGDGRPHGDLVVTADHGMVIDGYVINASALVNHDTIDFVSMAELKEGFVVYHIETENHDVILANGAASETFVDAAERRAFDNYQEYLDLYGAERIIPEMRQPRISCRRLVPEFLLDRLEIL